MRTLVVSTLLMVLCAPAWAQPTTTVEKLRQQNAELKRTIKRLEAKIRRLERSEPDDADAAKVRDLTEKIVTYRTDRNPGKMLDALAKLKTLHPRNSATYFLMGEAYASYGRYHDRAKAISAFKGFLKMTVETNQFGTSLHKMAEFAVVHDVRMAAQRYVDRLEQGYRMFVLTRPHKITKLRKELTADIARLHGVISVCRRKIATDERRIKVLSKNRRGVNIGTLRKDIKILLARIDREETMIGLMTAELQRLR